MAGHKTAKQMERHIKGMANHWRIEILLCIANQHGISVEGIIDELEGNDKTIGEHIRRLHHAGLIDKKYQGRSVRHTLSPYGKKFVSFLRSFQDI